MIKAVVFDLDNTLEEFTQHEDSVEADMSAQLAETYGLDSERFIHIFDTIKTGYLHSRSLPQDYGRDMWFRETLAHFDIFDADIDGLVQQYWDLLLERVRLFKGAEDVLQELKEDFALGILSDSDGDRYWKDQRIKRLHITKYFDAIVTSDDVRANKPHPRGFIEVCNQLNCSTDQAIMVGDHPEVDHIMAKELGMITVWVTQGIDEEHANREYSYVDHKIDKITEVVDLVKTLAQK